jgi:hypothetical protein
VTDRGPIKLKRYLCDGVYVGFDGRQMWLWTNRSGVEHEIALDAETYVALCKYTTDVANMIERKEPLEAERI